VVRSVVGGVDVDALEVPEAASQVPDAEEQLLEAAGKLTLRGLREECQRLEASSLIDEDQRHRRVHKQRRTWEWIPPEDRDVDLSALRRVITCARRC
jgi:hypothetical protein